jgi:hypothetical protein
MEGEEEMEDILELVVAGVEVLGYQMEEEEVTVEMVI